MVKTDFKGILDVPDEMFQKYGTSLIILRYLHERKSEYKTPFELTLITQAWASLNICLHRGILHDVKENELIFIAESVAGRWGDFVKFYRDRPSNSKFKYEKDGRERFYYRQYMLSNLIIKDGWDFLYLKIFESARLYYINLFGLESSTVSHVGTLETT